ncbi:hypothetical protein AOQ84DRAFT_352140 [Glonium stellatum]|uniref:Uncharacterized protein n=1 Tax=Glonium stellatum TaxID=574774 RepID=A0A8E2FA87_9PEZI|nr:hypothetical protein AOQ84DRAFT_352140 [Glonium stellatum]
MPVLQCRSPQIRYWAGAELTTHFNSFADVLVSSVCLSLAIPASLLIASGKRSSTGSDGLYYAFAALFKTAVMMLSPWKGIFIEGAVFSIPSH